MSTPLTWEVIYKSKHEINGEDLLLPDDVEKATVWHFKILVKYGTYRLIGNEKTFFIRFTENKDDSMKLEYALLGPIRSVSLDDIVSHAIYMYHTEEERNIDLPWKKIQFPQPVRNLLFPSSEQVSSSSSLELTDLAFDPGDGRLMATTMIDSVRHEKFTGMTLESDTGERFIKLLIQWVSDMNSDGNGDETYVTSRIVLFTQSNRERSTVRRRGDVFVVTPPTRPSNGNTDNSSMQARIRNLLLN